MRTVEQNKTLQRLNKWNNKGGHTFESGVYVFLEVLGLCARVEYITDYTKIHKRK